MVDLEVDEMDGMDTSATSCLKSDWDSPISSTILHITMELSWQWSFMKMS